MTVLLVAVLTSLSTWVALVISYRRWVRPTLRSIHRSVSTARAVLHPPTGLSVGERLALLEETRALDDLADRLQGR